jgi:hypothetical protein
VIGGGGIEEGKGNRVFVVGGGETDGKERYIELPSPYSYPCTSRTSQKLYLAYA